MHEDLEEIQTKRQQLRDEADLHLRLIDAMEYLAKAEETVTSALSALGLDAEAAEMSKLAVMHIHRAAEEMRVVKSKRQAELDLFQNAK